ncbi:hypothetical protein [Micromonospora kangleipakensis]|nr:hypothetical protein [Micromonospora kangleipakensis]
MGLRRRSIGLGLLQLAAPREGSARLQGVIERRTSKIGKDGRS